MFHSVAFSKAVWFGQLLGRAWLLSPELPSLGKGCGLSEFSALVSPIRASQVVLALKNYLPMKKTQEIQV